MSNYYIYPNNLRINQNIGNIYLPQMNNINSTNNIHSIHFNNARNINYINNQLINPYNNILYPNQQNSDIPIKKAFSDNSIPIFPRNNKNNLFFNDKNTLNPSIPINNKDTQNKSNLLRSLILAKPSVNPPSLTREQIETILSQLSKFICKIYGSNRLFGTGFFCRIPYQKKLIPAFITNNHVLNQDAIKNNKIIKFTIDDDKIEKNIKMDQSRIRFTNKEIDFTIIEIKPNIDGINDFLDVVEDFNENNYKNKMIYILQYPCGRESSHSLGPIGEIFGETIIHFCSTDSGSSGSPILSFPGSKVIGVHRRKGKIDDENISFNEGIFIKYIIEEINKSI